LLDNEKQLTLKWALRHIRAFVLLLFQHPKEVLGFVYRYPKKFLLGESGAPRGEQKTWRHKITSVKKLKQELFDLLKRNVEFFEITIPGRIGHQVGEVDLWLKERILQGKPQKTLVLVMDEAQAANPHFLYYCKQIFSFVIGKQLWLWLLRSIPEVASLHHLRHDYFHAFGRTAECYDIYRRWESREPLFKLSHDDREFLIRFLRENWGIGENDWYVCLHNRERGYSPRDDDLHEYRNASLGDFVPAIQEIVAHGGWVIRMGDSKMKALPPMDRVIDYANSPHKSPRLDVLLCASARFFLGSTSGLFILATVFGVPVASVNCIPMSSLPYTGKDVGIPKLLYLEREQRALSFREVMESPAANFRFSSDYKDSGLGIINNSSDEITDLVREMLDRTSNAYLRDPENERRQEVFRSLFKPGHYGYGTSAQVSQCFLRKHAALLSDSQI
jgi:putative glycosyltransferase (TIGR04372 family)